MVERLFADRTDRMGALRRRGGGRAHRVAISVAAGHAPFEASPTAAVALRLAILFDDRERVSPSASSSSRRPRQSRFSRLSSWLFLPDLCWARRVSAERMIAIALGFLGVVIATRPGTGAFQPIVLLAVAGVVCNSLIRVGHP